MLCLTRRRCALEQGGTHLQPLLWEGKHNDNYNDNMTAPVSFREGTWSAAHCRFSHRLFTQYQPAVLSGVGQGTKSDAPNTTPANSLRQNAAAILTRSTPAGNGRSPSCERKPPPSRWSEEQSRGGTQTRRNCGRVGGTEAAG